MLRIAPLLPARRDLLLVMPPLRSRPLPLLPTPTALKHLLKPFYRVLAFGRRLHPSLLVIRRRSVVLGRRRIPIFGLRLSGRVELVDRGRGVRSRLATREPGNGGARVWVARALLARGRLGRGDDGWDLELLIVRLFLCVARLPSAIGLLDGRSEGALILGLLDGGGGWTERAALLGLFLGARRLWVVARGRVLSERFRGAVGCCSNLGGGSRGRQREGTVGVGVL